MWVNTEAMSFEHDVTYEWHIIMDLPYRGYLGNEVHIYEIGFKVIKFPRNVSFQQRSRVVRRVTISLSAR